VVLLATTLMSLIGDLLFLGCLGLPPIVMLSRFIVGIASGTIQTNNLLLGMNRRPTNQSIE